LGTGDNTTTTPAWVKALGITGVVVIAALDAFVAEFDALPQWGYPVWIAAIALGDRVAPFIRRG
jgi:hypothetical protein